MAAKFQKLEEHWEKTVVICEKSNYFQFSEILLQILCFKTDVGPIPRGIEIAKFPPPDYINSPNWNKPIVGCYWCGKNNKYFKPTCCSKLCLYLLYEWCIERVKVVTDRDLCKLPNCNGPIHTNEGHVCCSADHKTKYNQFFQEFPKSKIKEIKIGPKWYDRDLKSNAPKQKQKLKNNATKNSIPPKPSPLPTRDLSVTLKEHLIYDTDIGPIPRSYKNEEHLRSRFSSSPNWTREISGCYQCLTSVKDKKEFLCSKSCYIIFNEWCRLKVSELVNEVYCKYPECTIKAIDGVFCGKDHKNGIKKKYSYLNREECESKVKKGPGWYTPEKPQSPKKRSKESSQRKPDISQILKKESVFSVILTKFLYEECDVGPIPRKLFELLPNIYSVCGLKNGNFNAIIPGCYWCCADDQSIYGIACSDLCFFLFHEWCFRKYQQSNSKRLFKFPRFESTVSVKKEYTDKYNKTFFAKYSSDLKSTNYALGPKWYLDTTSNFIDFYNREDPFYEFTNFHVCPMLIIDGQNWSTTEHYFQAQKFVGTPHCEFIRMLSTPRDAFSHSRRPEVQRWIRPDWRNVKETVMLKALEEKFNQNKHFKDLLIRTGDKTLYEHTKNDKFWGDGGDRKGENKLGILLMQVRFELHGREGFLPGFLNYFTRDGKNDLTRKTPSYNQNDVNQNQELPYNNNVLYTNCPSISDVYPTHPHGATPFLDSPAHISTSPQILSYNNFPPISGQTPFQTPWPVVGNSGPFPLQF